MAYFQESLLILNENVRSHCQDCVSYSSINAIKRENVFQTFFAMVQTVDF